LTCSTDADRPVCRFKVNYELENDFDKTFLLHGIEFGFDIVNTENLPVDIFWQKSMLQECSNLHADRVQPWRELNFSFLKYFTNSTHFFYYNINVIL
jgi:hypothetical protein